MPAVLPINVHSKVAVYVAVIDGNGHEGHPIRVGEVDVEAETFVRVVPTGPAQPAGEED